MTMKLLAGMFFALAAPSAALAHPGHHDGFTVSGLLEHIATSPFHALFWFLAAVALAGGHLAVRHARQKDER